MPGTISIYEYLYIHLPFCDVICHYCDFYTDRSKNARHEELFEAIHKELSSYQQSLAPKLKTIYFGGGTPGVTPSPLLAKFLKTLAPYTTPSTEITLEVNPNNVSEQIVENWAEAGVNRLSMGVQSLRDDLLKSLGRTHSGEDAKKALKICREKIPNITGDLMYALPGQSIEAPSEDAKELLDLGLKHISAYNLTLEKKHFLYAKVLPGDLAYQQIERLAKTAAERGLRHYEISNFALPGYESKHNQNYWRGNPYLALGPSAHGYDGGNRRWSNIADWEKYVSLLEQGLSPIENTESLTNEQLIIERIFTELRTEEGLDLAALKQRFGLSLEESRGTFLKDLRAQGLGEILGDRLKLSFRGRMLGDEIAAKLA